MPSQLTRVDPKWWTIVKCAAKNVKVILLNTTVILEKKARVEGTCYTSSKGKNIPAKQVRGALAGKLYKGFFYNRKSNLILF